jgi:D-glycero-alpha-D-manno-heptose-7-phosphate kinase
MLIRSRAPLRLGLSGGGTDVSPYSDEFGGCTLSTTINMYAYCTIEPTDNHKLEFFAADLSEKFVCETKSVLEIDGVLSLHKGIYNTIVKKFNNNNPLSFRMTTYSDALPGSGLGTSSTMAVTIIHAFVEWLKLPLGEYDIAHLAYEIERIDLDLKGGKQDQYSATFGGVNFIEFFSDDRVIVNPLRIKKWIKNELEDSLVLYYTGQSRDSSRIIEEQIKNAISKEKSSLAAMHKVKETAIKMKEAVLTGDFDSFVKCLARGWEEKKKASSVITNENLENSYTYAIQNGAKAGKISGAGGGGFFMFFVDIANKIEFIRAMENKGGMVICPKFVINGSEAWTINNL